MCTLSTFSFDALCPTSVKQGKVRDTCVIDGLFVMVTTDRLSAFDRILPILIPHKGQILTELSAHFMRSTASLVPNWLLQASGYVSIGLCCTPLPVEIIVRAYLCGHAFRQYRDGKRCFFGNHLPEGLQENDKLPVPILTPTTKATQGHDEDIDSMQQLRKVLGPARCGLIVEYAKKLFAVGSRYAQARGLLLVDAKYEFGIHKNDVYLADELHTPDSARYFYEEDYTSARQRGSSPTQLSKEFVRQWLLASNVGVTGTATLPTFDDGFIQSVQKQYMEVYRVLMERSLTPFKAVNLLQKNILSSITHAIASIKKDGFSAS